MSSWLIKKGGRFALLPSVLRLKHAAIRTGGGRWSSPAIGVGRSYCLPGGQSVLGMFDSGAGDAAGIHNKIEISQKKMGGFTATSAQTFI